MTFNENKYVIGLTYGKNLFDDEADLSGVLK